MKKFGDEPKFYVVAHTDGIRACGFRLKLRRGDGALVDQSSAMNAYIWIYDADWNLFGGAWAYNESDPSWIVMGDLPNKVYSYDDGCNKFKYDSATGCWEISSYTDPDYPFVPNKDGYFVTYDCKDSLWSQYPYRYKGAEQFAPADLVKPGSYTDVIPYWKVDTHYEGVESGSPPGGGSEPISVNYYPWPGSGGSIALKAGGVATKHYVVTSSVPYRMRYNVSLMDQYGGNTYRADGDLHYINSGGVQCADFSDTNEIWRSTPALTWHYETPFVPGAEWVFARAFDVSGDVSWSFVDDETFMKTDIHGAANPGFIEPRMPEEFKYFNASAEYQSLVAVENTHTLAVTNNSGNYTFNSYWMENWEWTFPSFTSVLLWASVPDHIWEMSATYDW